MALSSLFILYAIFPFAVPPTRSSFKPPTRPPTHPKTQVRTFLLTPLFFCCSVAKPVADLSINLGVISALARVAALASIPDFLQGKPTHPPIYPPTYLPTHPLSHNPQYLIRTAFSSPTQPTHPPTHPTGINLGLMFLEHDWSKHPLIFQKFGLSVSLAAACSLFVMVDLLDCPIFVQLWRPYGMLQFLWMPVIWYAAHGKG